ncbi:MAG: hypothetical protein V3S14_15100, partial [Anaerolineae bacterium]
MLRSLSVSRRISAFLPTRLTRLVLAVITGSLVSLALLLWLATIAPSVQAAPPARPLAQIVTDTVLVTHTSNTTHEMSVFGNGKITDQFRDNNDRNQIDQNAPYGDATTIAIMFDQHALTSNPVDVGLQGEFTPTTPITL